MTIRDLRDYLNILCEHGFSDRKLIADFNIWKYLEDEATNAWIV